MKASFIRDLKAHFLGLANPTRLAIIAELVEGETSGSELARRLKVSQPLLSWHLRIMRRAGLITTRRGQLTVINRAGIEQVAGSFYGIPEAELKRLMADA